MRARPATLAPAAKDEIVGPGDSSLARFGKPMAASLSIRSMGHTRSATSPTTVPVTCRSSSCGPIASARIGPAAWK
jgi:hypothetical protein